jgi:thiol-disulfide isomerase/thioredoxin
MFWGLLLAVPLVLGGCGARQAAERETPRGGGIEDGSQARDPQRVDGSEVGSGTAAPERHEPAAAAEPEVRPAEIGEILAAVGTAGKDAVVLNVWATWCVPCREEFPDLVRLQREYRDRGLGLMLVSADFDDRLPEVKRFLQNQGVDYPSYLKTGDDMEFINALSPKWSGALPATFIYDRAGKLRFFHEGKVTFQQLERQVLEIIDPAASRPGTEERS